MSLSDNKIETSELQKIATSAGSNRKKSGEVWVKKWVDYSSKYGLGYYFSNDAIGVYFNDQSKMIIDPNGYHFDYFERNGLDR